MDREPAEAEVAGPQLLALGSLIRELRRDLGLTQDQAAKLAGVSRSAYSKWEEGARKPRVEHIERVGKVLEADEWRYRKMMSLVSSAVSIQIGMWPPELNGEDIDILENFGFPAMYRRLPDYGIIHINSLAEQVYPMFAPAPPEARHPTNMIEVMFTDIRSKIVFVDWEMVAWRMTYMMRLWSRGIAPEILSEIQENCTRASPDFAGMWAERPPPEYFANNRISVRDLHTRAVSHYTLCSWLTNYPPRPFEILGTPRRSAELVAREMTP
ncbi:helix-turn-helix domain-containing protein [Nocardia panacis]|uniref:helix-turn-helix domain-containing protein n=1 Tax=Nocardia panacis TaxID=2340916 RepID=UPI001315294F|nr:helix-turn-helix domain-containing protein [Nocardia panacis]